MTTTVALEGMEFYAFHGYYEFERRVGNNFRLDVHVEVSLDEDPDDQIDKTVNYEEIYQVSAQYMKKKYQLLESVAYDIAHHLKSQYKKVEKVTVSLSKPNPSLGGKAARAKVVIVL